MQRYCPALSGSLAEPACRLSGPPLEYSGWQYGNFSYSAEIKDISLYNT